MTSCGPANQTFDGNLSITSADINNGAPLVVTKETTTIPITTGACQLLATPTISAESLTGIKVSASTPFPRYYDREQDTATTAGFVVTRSLTLEDGNNNSIVATGFTITMEFPACTSFAVGDGTDAANAYAVDSAPRLELLSRLVNTDNANYRDKYYKVTTDIDMGLPGFPLSEAGSGTTGKGFDPIGRENTNFRGTFDCNGKTISNLYINRPTENSIGLVGRASSATIRNCALTDVSITGSNDVGGLVGVARGSSTISDSYATGTVTGNGGNNVGGLVGVARGSPTISDSYATVAISGDDRVGGLVGYVESTTISNSYATGAVSGINDVGGLVGENFQSTISNSYATGAVSGSSQVGGLVGSSRIGGFTGSSITDSYATGTVSGINDVGGLVGFNSDSSTISNSYATGAVSEIETVVGGLVGWANFSEITNSYAIGAVTGTTTTYIGLFIGLNGSSTQPTDMGVTASYYNSESILTVGGSVVTAKGVGSDGGSSLTANLAGRTTSKMQVAAPQSGVYEGWANTTWNFTSGQYPRLINVACANRQYNQAATGCTNL